MSSSESAPEATRSGRPEAPASTSPRVSLWIRELPYGLVLLLTILGVAYTSYLKQPITAYWEILAPLIAALCVGAGWQNADDKAARFRLIWTQALHWLAFLVVMYVAMLPGVQSNLGVSATGLSVLTLLALGTFTAGIHVLSWQICLLGLVMALCVPAIAWIEASALIVALIIVAALGLGAIVAWHWHERKADEAGQPGTDA